MTQIINPMIFYWMSVADALKVAFVILAIVFGAAALVFTVYGASTVADNEEFGADDKDYKSGLKLLKHGIKCAIICLIFVAAAIFVPSKETLTEMVVAKLATVENTELSVDAIKSAVDYIFEKIAELNG